jgi:hypothetical protein
MHLGHFPYLNLCFPVDTRPPASENRSTGHARHVRHIQEYLSVLVSGSEEERIEVYGDEGMVPKRNGS